ncbi:MAG: hypothetical protein EU541_06225 [Promethearchaeota archaeon]|nr:MAG: hypothetical protein EU541_06225 [Candidatus Lokiarchaeota archaeon]
MRKNLFIENEKMKLESEFYDSDSNKSEAILLAHPHPGYGGSMHNNVVSGIFRVLIENDIPCLRFNFIGVGDSQNKGSDEVDPISQVQFCIDFLSSQKSFSKILICGYSYGAAISCSAVNYSDKVIGFIAISFPWDFMGSRFKELSQTKKPKFFIQGNRDNIAPYGNFMEHYDSYQEPKSYEVIKGANHFYRGFESQISKSVVEFYNKIL